jgi:hypothetical protein
LRGVPGFKGPAEAKYPEHPKGVPSPNILLNILKSSKLISEEEEVGHTCPLANTIAINAADSITHDNGFHMKPRNLRILFSCTR